MPRRRISKGRESGSRSKSKPFHKADGKLKKWNTISDIPIDEEDQFHASKDKILLNGDQYGGYDDDGDDDEVFALKGIDDNSEEDEGLYEDNEILDDEAEIETEAPGTKKKSKHSRKVKGKTVESPEPEEEEEEKEEEEGWGRGRAAYYSSNAVELESDDEEGNELEEQEAKRLQAAARKEMADDDFGLNDNPEVMQNDPDMEYSGIAESTPSVLPSLPKDKKGLLRHLEKTSPESLALARDWDETARNLHKTQERISKIEAENPDAIHLGMVHLHYQALLSYSTMLAFYLHLRSSAKYSQRPSLLQSHPILQRLLTLKHSLATLEDLDFAGSDSEDDEDDGSLNMDDILADGEQVWRFDDAEGLEPDELAELLEDASAKKLEKRIQTPPKKKRKTTTQDHLQPVGPIFDLVEPQFVSSKNSSSHEPLANDADAFGEMTALHFADLADKNVRKKSLRFHTSKIDSTSARRQGARNQALGGDDDLPYRQRRKEKDAQLVKEAVKKLSNQGGDDLDGEDPEPPRVGEKRSRQDEDEEDPDGYYELVKKKSTENKEKKKADYEEANGRVRFDLDEDNDGGPRSLTRAILKNRGLTPHRPKSVRNPRVKKRMRYEKAKKTVSSQKAIYKGGLSQTGGRYEGEKSGISKVVKSIRLG